MFDVENAGELISEILKSPGVYLEKMPTLFSSSVEVRRCNAEVKYYTKLAAFQKTQLLQTADILKKATAQLDATILVQAEAFVKEVVDG